MSPVEFADPADPAAGGRPADPAEGIAAFFRRHPECRLRALGLREHAAVLDLTPLGIPAEHLDALAQPQWIERYQQANRACFSGELALPGWVCFDLFLLPAAIGMITCPARYLTHRPPGLADDDEAVAAAYYAAPSIQPATVVGVSLISLRRHIGAAAVVKLLTLKMLKARRQLGVTQWDNPSLRVHTSLGPLRIEGPAPGHGLAARTFVYSLDLAAQKDDRTTADAAWIPVADLSRLNALAHQAAKGAHITILPPGLSRDGKTVRVRVD